MPESNFNIPAPDTAAVLESREKYGSIPGKELVVGDAMIAEEGGLVMADGVIIRANDLR